ncbi:retinol dehydrogenase 12 [Colletotrichum tofieldiae]|uniref:Retinol dehydrogenase 12 n=1 Tax=Colletotrichum tofieldiae TaxID=708197 RepID=A0A166LVX0_9PEZI|nr:retinol dehydrogenase 12 [Colletotrichum tofieldiae]
MDAFRGQLESIPVPTTLFSGQTIVVTGSNTGLGYEAAKHFVRLDAKKVILAVRSVKKGEAARATIEASTGRKAVIEVWQLEMDDYDSIKAFATRCNSLDRLDAVVENAGVLRNTFEASERVEISVKVNVIGTFLLALNLFSVLRRSHEKTGQMPRLVITSSSVHYNAKFRERHEPSIFDALNQNKQSRMNDRYNVSKLLEVMLVRSLSRAMDAGPHAAEPIILNTVHPGLCESELDKDVKGLAGYVLTFAKALVARTTEEGGRTLVHSSAAGTESHGKYMSECRVREPSAFVRSREGAEAEARVHKELMVILESIQPGITKNI